MIDLPSGFPMYCTDLKQMMDESRLNNEWKNRVCPEIKGHHALSDARWNKDLYQKIQDEKLNKILQDSRIRRF
jgi:hypothetical protein